MAIAPVHRLKKQEIIWLANNRCKHSHTYLEHYSCFLKEYENKPSQLHSNIPIPHRIGFFDIETSNLQATFGIMLSYAIKDSESPSILGRCITKRELGTCLDKLLVEECVKDIQKFDRIVGFYSTKFDLPYTRTRAVYHQIPFPGYQTLLHTDVYYIVRNKFRLHSNRLESAYNMLVGTSNKTHWGRDYWIKALQGDRQALDYIWDHNKWDVKDLEELYNKVVDFTMRTDRSI